MEAEVRAGVADVALGDEGAKIGKCARRPWTGEAVESDRESTTSLVREDVGGCLEGRLQELACFVVIPREEGLDEASEAALRAVGRELDSVDEDLAFSLELDDLVGIEHGVEWDLLG